MCTGGLARAERRLKPAQQREGKLPPTHLHGLLLIVVAPDVLGMRGPKLPDTL